MNTLQRNVLRLIARSPKDQDGWAEVSAALFPILSDAPSELIETEGDAERGGRVRFTHEGNIVIKYL